MGLFWHVCVCVYIYENILIFMGIKHVYNGLGVITS